MNTFITFIKAQSTDLVNMLLYYKTDCDKI